MTITNDMIQATPGMILPIDLENIFQIDWNAVTDCRYIYNYDIEGEELKELLKSSAYTFINSANLKLELCLNNLQFEQHTVANNMQIGLYEPHFIRTALDDSTYSILRGIFNDYYDFRRKYIGHRAIILDHHRFTFLKHNYDLVKDAMVTYSNGFHLQSHSLTLHKLFKAYVVSFDCHLLGNGNLRDWSFIDVVKKTCVDYEAVKANNSTMGISPIGGHKFNSMIRDINLEEYKIISQILDRSDQDYSNFVRKTNIDLSNALNNHDAQVARHNMLFQQAQIVKNNLLIQQAQTTDDYLGIQESQITNNLLNQQSQVTSNLSIQQAQATENSLGIQQPQVTDNYLSIQQPHITNNHLGIQQSQVTNNHLEIQQSQSQDWY